MTVRPERHLTPLTTTDAFLAEILGELRDLRSELTQAPPEPPDPAPEPEESEDPEPAPVLVTEPAPVRPPRPDPATPLPPRSGRGATRAAWAEAADRLGIPYPPGAGQRAIVAAVDAARAEVAT